MLKIIPINIIFLTFFLLPGLGHSKNIPPETPINWNTLPLSQKIKSSLTDDNYALSQIESYTDPNTQVKKQRIHFLIAGLHKKSCSRALLKLSQYERFQEFIDFVKKSSYEKGRIKLFLGHSLLPFDMSLHFLLERIETPGRYHFKFDQGFLKGLKGEIHITDHVDNSQSRCLFYSTAKWQGKNSGIPDNVFSFFSRALALKAMERLFHISETL